MQRSAGDAYYLGIIWALQESQFVFVQYTVNSHSVPVKTPG